ncbi:MAG: aspartate carbamoyltransferase regulatory subunit [Planctomycetota bacterium]|jgi:aspartate carbamoyltransferase regulatory subunit
MRKKIVENNDGGEPSKSIKVSALRQGTVIDHLNRGTGMRAIKVLGLQEWEGTVTIGLNLESGRLGAKDLIKVENKELSQAEVNQIALLSPAATFSIIRNFQVVEKIYPELPETIEGLINCTNPKCVTNNFDDVVSKFLVTQKQPIKLRCYFCERTFSRREIDLI